MNQIAIRLTVPLLLHTMYYHLIDEPNSTRAYRAIATACSVLSFDR